MPIEDLQESSGASFAACHRKFNDDAATQVLLGMGPHVYVRLGRHRHVVQKVGGVHALPPRRACRAPSQELIVRSTSPGVPSSPAAYKPVIRFRAIAVSRAPSSSSASLCTSRSQVLWRTLPAVMLSCRFCGVETSAYNSAHCSATAATSRSAAGLP